MLYVHAQFCPVCETEQMPNELQVLRDIDFWKAHCEEMFRAGSNPSSFSKLPKYLQTDEMKEYYVKLSKRIKAREAWLKNQEAKSA